MPRRHASRALRRLNPRVDEGTLGEIVEYLAKRERIPFAWVVEHAPDGNLEAVVQEAWAHSTDPHALFWLGAYSGADRPSLLRATLAIARATAEHLPKWYSPRSAAISLLRTVASTLRLGASEDDLERATNRWYQQTERAKRQYWGMAIVDRDVWTPTFDAIEEANDVINRALRMIRSPRPKSADRFANSIANLFHHEDFAVLLHAKTLSRAKDAAFYGDEDPGIVVRPLTELCARLRRALPPPDAARIAARLLKPSTNL